jgi:hypothetical protein
MIPLTTTAKNALEQSVSVSFDQLCTLEYNMNSLVDNIVVTGADITKTDSSGNTYTPFKKLFPVDSIVKPFRPVGSGIKYAISGDIGSSSYRDPKTTDYLKDFRVYYPGVDTYYKYYVSGIGLGIDVTATYPKTILTNKVVARFELSHSTPSTWTIYGNGSQLATGTSANIVPITTGGSKNYNSGTVTIYYNGTSWSTTEPATPAAPVSLTSVRVTTSGVSGKYVGLIELSPRWYIDISDRVVSFAIDKESSSGSEDLLPVGNVTANSIIMQLVSFESDRVVKTFDKSNAFDSAKVYLYKKVQINPSIKVYNSGGSKTDYKGAYDIVNQGTFFMDEWSISEHGEVSVQGLDGAKILQETIAPGILCEGYSITAIIRRLLDTVGFTNYKINVKDTDKSVFATRYWWTENNKTVWEAIQELCRDSQMTAVFSYDNVLQFYSREYLFDSASAVDWTFRHQSSGSDLPNILNLNKRELPSANQVKVFWNSVATSDYQQSSGDIWRSDPYWLGAFSLDRDLPSTTGAGAYMYLSPSVLNEEEFNITLYSYNGYLVIDSEIIEYDAIQFQYLDATNTLNYVDVTAQGDEMKFRGLAVSGSDNFKPSGKYKIKQRGAFGTKVTNHYAAADSIVNSWNERKVKWVM